MLDKTIIAFYNFSFPRLKVEDKHYCLVSNDMFVQSDPLYFEDMMVLILKCLIWCSFPLLYSQNLEIKTDTAKSLADSLDRADCPSFPYLNTLLRILATRCMMQAVYFCSGMDNDFHHYGLASPIYTHFTSPIRRYFFPYEMK